MGGLVSTYGAGSAVPDWPTIFGHNPLCYPLKDWITVLDVFLEHGHRLVGYTVGLLTLMVAAALWRADRRPAGRWLALAAVAIWGIQETLGGLRVIFDQLLLAKLHASTAPIFLAVCGGIVAYTSPAWRRAGGTLRRQGTGWLNGLSAAAAGLAYLQIVLGVQLRHLGYQQSPGWFPLWVWLHVITAGLLALLVLWVVLLTGRRFADQRMLVWRAGLLAAALSVQLLLGGLTWLTNYGWPGWLRDYFWAIGYVVPAGRPLEAVATTAHVALGCLTLMAAVSLGLWSRRLAWARPSRNSPDQPAGPGSPFQ